MLYHCTSVPCNNLNQVPNRNITSRWQFNENRGKKKTIQLDQTHQQNADFTYKLSL